MQVDLMSAVGELEGLPVEVDFYPPGLPVSFLLVVKKQTS